MTTNSKGELLLAPDGPLVYYTAYKQAVAAYEAEFVRLKAVTDEQAQCAKVEELKNELEQLAQQNHDMQVALNQIYGIAQDYENV
jgi:hypothetical protein